MERMRRCSRRSAILPACRKAMANTRRGETGRAMQSCGLMMTLFITVPIVLICIFMGM